MPIPSLPSMLTLCMLLVAVKPSSKGSAASSVPVLALDRAIPKPRTTAAGVTTFAQDMETAALMLALFAQRSPLAPTRAVLLRRLQDQCASVMMFARGSETAVMMPAAFAHRLLLAPEHAEV
jgi:hypothetical protein